VMSASKHARNARGTRIYDLGACVVKAPKCTDFG
jgi:hypothetical protein